MQFLIGLVAVLAIIGVLISEVVRPGKDKAKKFGDGYFYFMAFVALLVLYWGVADLFRIILEKVWIGGITPRYVDYGYANTSYAYETWLRGISLRVSAILVAVPIWLFHWHKATSKAKEEMDIAGHQTYLFAVVIVMGLSSIGMLIGALYFGVNAMLGISLSDDEFETFAYLLPYSLGAVGLWWAHWRIWQAKRKELAAVAVVKEEEVK